MNDIRMPLSDKSIAQLPTPRDGWYLARDTELNGFFVVVGKRKRTFTVQGDLRQGGKRASLMNHSIPRVNAGYVTRHKLLEDHLRSQQQAISTAVFAAIGKMLRRTPTCEIGSDAAQADVSPAGTR
jgi:hypothetical protein